MNYTNLIEEALQFKGIQLKEYQDIKGIPLTKEQLNNSLEQFLQYYHELHLNIFNNILSGPYLGIVSEPNKLGLRVIHILLPNHQTIQILYWWYTT